MPITITSPDQRPYGVLHPAAHYRAVFREAGMLWPSVAQFCLAHIVAAAADRKRVRSDARDPEHARTLAQSMPRLPEMQPRMFEILCHAYRAAIEQNLDLCALLVRMRGGRSCW